MIFITILIFDIQVEKNEKRMINNAKYSNQLRSFDNLKYCLFLSGPKTVIKPSDSSIFKASKISF